MKVKHYTSEFELVETKQSEYQVLQNAIEKAEFIRQNKEGTYKLHNGGYLAELKTYSIIDTETGYCINNNRPLTINNCITLIKMYC